MERTSLWSLRKSLNLPTNSPTTCYKFHKPLSPTHYPYPYTYLHLRITNPCFVLQAKAKKSPILKPTIVEEVSMDDDDEDDNLIFDEFADDDDDGLLLDDDGDFEDGYLEEEDAEPFAGDGEGGGGVSLAGTSWDNDALEMAEEVALLLGDLGIYSFKTLLNSTIRVRVEKLSNKSGSPSMDDIEAFSVAYRKRLDEAELAGSIPENLSLEVSSPGVERVVRIPQDLERFKDRSMFVKYLVDVAETDTSNEKDGIFKLISFNLETNTCIWGIADVRVNREKAGKGRPLSKKQREWRLETPFDSIRFVRLYSGN